MKKVLVAGIAAFTLAQPAIAADMPVKAVRAPIEAAWNWTGFYAGINGGYSWGRSNTTATFTDIVTGATLATGSADISLAGPLGGFQIGYNVQSGNIVWGIEADIQATNQRGSATFICAAVDCAAGPGTPVTASINQKLDWFGTVRGRLGMTFSPWMAYVTGGLAYGRISSDGSISGASLAGPVTTTFSTTHNKGGWVFGGGIESRLSGNWTLKAEYLYMDLGTIDSGGIATTIAPPVRTDFLGGAFSSRITDNIFRVGLNHKFGG